MEVVSITAAYFFLDNKFLTIFFDFTYKLS